MSTANTDVFVDCDQAPEAPEELPSYKDLAPVQDPHAGPVRQDVKIDAKADAEVDDEECWPSASSSQPSSSSTQLFAPSQGLRVTDNPRDAAEARKIDFETWPRGPRLRTDAVYGLCLKADNLYGKGSNGGVTSLKITDYHGGVLYHLRFASNGVPKGAMECVHMVPGDETSTTVSLCTVALRIASFGPHLTLLSACPHASQPCSSWRLPMMIPTVLRVSGAFPKSRSPALPSNWTWRQDYDYKHRVESIDGRLSRMSCSLNQQERQVLTKDCLPMHRDWFAFTVPAKQGEKNQRTFVWLASVSGLVLKVSPEPRFRTLTWSPCAFRVSCGTRAVRDGTRANTCCTKRAT